MISATRVGVLSLNERARKALKATNALKDDLGIIEVRNSDESIANEYTGMAVAAGEVIVFGKNDKALGVENGTIGVVQGLFRSGGRTFIDVEVNDDSGKVRFIRVDTSTYKNIDYGYATTAHKAQGQTVDYVSVYAGPSMDGTLLYSAMSRHRKGVKVHWQTDQFAKGQPVEQAFAAFRAKVTRPSESKMASSCIHDNLDAAADTASMSTKQRLDEIRKRAAGWQRKTSRQTTADASTFFEEIEKAQNRAQAVSVRSEPPAGV